MKYSSWDYFTALKDIVLQYTWNNYDYCYLKAMHEKNRTIGTETIIAGSSYTLNGIVNENITGGCINFSIQSQDIYYDLLNIKKAVEEGKKKIKNCIINIGYYALYQDLSYSKIMRTLIHRTYYPLFADAHHHIVEKEFDLLEGLSYDQSIFSIELIRKICEEWSDGFFLQESSFYGSLMTRENNNALGIKKVTWHTLNEEEKQNIAFKRASDHNRLKQHEQTCEENKKLIREMAAYLHEYHITPVFVIFPFTEWYNKYINKDYKAELLDVLESVPYPVEFLDMNDHTGIVDDPDFLDTDRLNKQGAVKTTEFLNEFMWMIAQEG